MIKNLSRRYDWSCSVLIVQFCFGYNPVFGLDCLVSMGQVSFQFRNLFRVAAVVSNMKQLLPGQRVNPRQFVQVFKFNDTFCVLPVIYDVKQLFPGNWIEFR